MRRLLAVPLVVLLTAARASAQGADAVTSEAQHRFQEGLLLHDAGHDEEAYAKFVQAYAMVQSPSVLFNLARTEQLTGRLLEARVHFRQYTELSPNTPKVQESLRQKAYEFLAEIQTVAPEVGVPAAPPAPAVSSPEPSHPPANPQPPAPTVVSGRPPTDTVAEPSTGGWPSTRSWLAPTLGLLAVGAIGTGVGLQVAAQNDARHASDLSSQLPPGTSICVQTNNAACQPLYDANHSGQDKRNLALPFTVAGAALAAVTLAVLLWPTGKSRTETALHLTASPASAGLQLRGGF